MVATADCPALCFGPPSGDSGRVPTPLTTCLCRYADPPPGRGQRAHPGRRRSPPPARRPVVRRRVPTTSRSVRSDAPRLVTHSPLFVTWKKRDDGGSYRLRGCIGTFAPQILTVSCIALAQQAVPSHE